MEYLDSEMIITEVQKYPCLYDATDQWYKDREVKKHSWMSVTMVVTEGDWDHIDEQKKSEMAKEVQKRWKSMKDSFFKSVKEGRRGDPDAKPKKPYIYHRQMAFLLTVVQPRETSGTMNMNSEIDDNSETGNEKPAYPTVVQKTSRSSNKRKADAFEEEIVNNLHENAKFLKSLATRPPSHAHDPDEMFLLSQVPIIKQLTPADKLDFQVEFMKLLQSYSKRIPSSSSSFYDSPSIAYSRPT